MFVKLRINTFLCRKRENHSMIKQGEMFGRDASVYHIGASIKDLGKKIFAFSILDIPAKKITSLL